MGRVIANRYELEDEIGRGGMAMVYRARDVRLHRFVALKLMHPFLASQSESSSRFLREAEAIAKLHHPNIVEIFDTGRDEETGSQFLVMELVDGPTLTQFIHAHPVRIPEVAVAMACSLCDAVAHAHGANIIHRDIKPENIMVSADGVLKLMDFGIARILDAERMTASGSIIGSPAHMPPEIIEGQRYSFTCDIFSLGTVIYFMLTGELPFKGPTPGAVFHAILDGAFALPSRYNMAVTRRVDRIVETCLKVAPGDRYQTADALKEAMLEVLRPAGFADYGTVVARFCADPDAYQDGALPAVQKNLLAGTRQALRMRRIPVAVENLNILLAYDPENREAVALLQRIRNGSAMRRHVIAIALILLCLLGVGAIVWFAPWDDSATDAVASSANPEPMAVLESPGLVGNAEPVATDVPHPVATFAPDPFGLIDADVLRLWDVEIDY